MQVKDLGDDPYRHLADEQYEVPFNQPKALADSLICMSGRQTISLDGSWRFVLDLHDEGLRQRWFENEPGNMEEWVLPYDYDDGNWQQAQVPSCWNVSKPEWFYFEGSAWYSREFDFSDKKTDERLFLRVGAANYVARIFLNGQFVGMHQGGSTPFFFELSGMVREGKNTLRIQVENRRSPARVPMNHIDWFNYGGLYREVSLVSLPKTFIKHFSLSLVPNSEGKRIRIGIQLSNDVDQIAYLNIDGLINNQSVQICGGIGLLEIDAAPQLWSLENPFLYQVNINCGEDEVTDRIGFREISVRGEQILLNGKEIFLKGVAVHEDDSKLGKSVTEESLRSMFNHVRELNANFVRLSHYPHHERAAQIADEMGILLWEEIPVYWAIAFDNPETLSDAENQLRELIRRDINRASVIIWGVGNENHDSDHRFNFMKHLAKVAREEDATRLISAACLINREKFQIEDRLAEYLDLIGINEYFGWYEPSFDGLVRLINNSSPGKPVIITEMGADACAGKRDPQARMYSEERQAKILEGQYAILKTASYIRGICPWILYDFRAERRQTALHCGRNLKGLIDADKSWKKLGFEVVAKQYSQ